MEKSRLFFLASILIIFGLFMVGFVDARLPKYSCTDTDGGVYAKTKGTVSGYSIRLPYNHSDFCINIEMLNEYYCSASKAISKNINCSSTQKYCMDGACTSLLCGNSVCDSTESIVTCPQDCLNPDSCSDSDGGNNLMIKGTTYGFANSINYSQADYCTDVASVNEFYCSGVVLSNSNQNCGNDGYSAIYCASGKAYKNYTDFFCSTGKCNNNLTIIPQVDSTVCSTPPNATNISGSFLTDFETDNGWMASGVGQGKFEIGIPSNFNIGTECVTSCIGTGIPTDHTLNGTNAACTNLNGHMRSYETISTNNLTSPKFNLTGKRNITLELWRFMEIEGNNFDFCYYQYKNDASNIWKTFETYGVAQIDDNEWKFYTKDLSQFADNMAYFQIRFYCTTDDWNEGSGLCLDDIKLRYGSDSYAPIGTNVTAGYLVTSYLDVNEALYYGNKTRVMDSSNSAIGYYKNDFLAQVRIDGSGKGDGINNSGLYLHYDYAVDDGKTYYLLNYSSGAWNNQLVPWTGVKPSIAINPQLPQGTKVRFSDLGPDAASYPSWVNDLLMNKTFYVDDRFSLNANNLGKFIDVYVGLQPVHDMNGRPESLYLRNTSVLITIIQP